MFPAGKAVILPTRTISAITIITATVMTAVTAAGIMTEGMAGVMTATGAITLVNVAVITAAEMRIILGTGMITRGTIIPGVTATVTIPAGIQAICMATTTTKAGMKEGTTGMIMELEDPLADRGIAGMTLKKAAMNLTTMILF